MTGAPAAADSVTLPDAGGAVTGATDTVTSTVGDVTPAVGDVTSTVDDVVATVEGAAGAATGTGGSSGSSSGGSTSGGVVGSAVGTVTQVAGASGSTASGGDASSSRSTASAGSQPGERARGGQVRMRTRFDQLPRRFEALLERIELGRNVRANLRRLERALASASPELRRRVLRSIRAEIARLRKGGVTPVERRRIGRLQRVSRELTQDAGATGRSVSASPTAHGVQFGKAAVTPTSAVGPGSQGHGGARKDTGVLSAQAGGGVERPELGPVPVPTLPDGSDRVPFWIGLGLLALLVLGFVGVVVAVTNHMLGRARSS